MKIISSLVLVFSLFANEACNQSTTIDNSSSTKKELGATEVVDITTYLDGQSFPGMEHAVVAGGCFWCVEAAFQQIEGIVEAISGYSGGHVKNPSYEAVCTHKTGHAEAVYLIYDPNVITYSEILDIFFVAHDPTTLNSQGPDVGESYKSALYPMNESQAKIIEAQVAAYNESTFNGNIVTDIQDYEEFWVAEAYHQDFYWNNPNQGYVRAVSKPKVEKVAKVFSDRLKMKK